jgi:Transposase
MKASKFSDAQKAFILKQGKDGVPVAEICRKAGISQATYFNWKKKYDGMQPPEMRRLKQLEDRIRPTGACPLSDRYCHLGKYAFPGVSLRGDPRLRPHQRRSLHVRG